MAKKRPYCLTIGGFDPSGGAGVIADCKTFEQFKTIGLSVLTCNTIQTEDLFNSFNWLNSTTIESQLSILLDRYPITHVKIGLIENTSVLLSIINQIKSKIPNCFLVWDPVLTPTSGGNIDPNRFNQELNSILQKIDLVTPNIPESKILFGDNAIEEVSVKQNLIIYLKGGHSDKKGVDLVYFPSKKLIINPKIDTFFTKHGTGCILSSAIIANLIKGYPIRKALIKAKEYTEKRIVSNPSLLAFHT